MSSLKTVRDWASEVWDKPVVSIVCWTYNHAEFLEQAIESFLEQTTDFPVEIVIHDDASDDSTPAIIQRYSLQYPRAFVPILQPVNRFKQGLDINEPAYQKATGKYIALCEGDDYWVKNDKLQAQVDFLERNSDLVGCFHRGYAVNAVGEKVPFVWDNIEYRSSYSQEACIFELLSGYPTASLVFKRNCLTFPFPDYFIRYPTDFMFDILLTESGALAFVDFVGCVYRQHAGGIWSNLTLADMKTENARRYACLYQNRILRQRYPRVKSHMIRQIDVLWWIVFQETVGGVAGSFRALRHVAKSLIPSQIKPLLIWLWRTDCPFYFNTKRVFFSGHRQE